MSTGEGEICQVVVERGRRPGRCCVALCTVGWKSSCDMIRVCCAVEIINVAVVAYRGQALILVVHVTVRTYDGLMGTSEWKLGVVMAERRWCPGCRRVARSAVMAKVAGNMVRLQGNLEIRLMALIAIRVDKLVVPVHMARLTDSGHVGSGKGKRRLVVIKA